MPDEKRVIPKGTMFMLASGLWSEYRIHVVVVALQNIDLDQLQQEHWEETGSEFIDWLLVSGLVTMLDCEELIVARFEEHDKIELQRERFEKVEEV